MINEANYTLIHVGAKRDKYTFQQSVQINCLLLSACEQIYNILHSWGLRIYTHIWPTNFKK